jgi:hypothetical protein
MKTNTLRNPLFILALVSGVTLTTGCGDDDNASPSTTSIEDEDSGAPDDNDNSDDTNASDDGDASDTSATSDTDTTTESDTTAGADASDTSGPDEGDASAETDEDAAVINEDAGTETIADAGSDAGPVTEECVENDDACFSCPSTPEQFLKQCEAPGTQCSAFDNATRLGLYVEGQPLPTP